MDRDPQTGAPSSAERTPARAIAWTKRDSAHSRVARIGPPEISEPAPDTVFSPPVETVVQQRGNPVPKESSDTYALPSAGITATNDLREPGQYLTW